MTVLSVQRTGWTRHIFKPRKVNFIPVGKITVVNGARSKEYGLLVDGSVKHPEDIELFKQQLSVESLCRLSHPVSMAEMWGGADQIAVSEYFGTNGVFYDGKGILALGLRGVMQESGRIQKEMAERKLAEAKTILFNGGVNEVVSPKGTRIYHTGDETSAGERSLKHLGENILPLRVKDIYEKESRGFWNDVKRFFGIIKPGKELEFYKYLLSNIGLKNIGKYEVEVAIARELYIRGELSESSLAGIRSAICSGDEASPGDALRLALEAAGGKYLKSFKKKLAKNIQKRLGPTAREINKKRKLHAGKDDVAILSLAVSAGLIKKEKAINHARGQYDEGAGNLIEEVKSYLKTEEDRIVSLWKSISCLAEILD